MEFGALFRKMINGVIAGDGDTVASCFTPDGVYKDVFYGAFEGRDRIAEMIRDYFHRDGCNFRWDTHNPVSDGTTGYVRYVFSYESKLEAAKGKRTMFEGVAVVTEVREDVPAQGCERLLRLLVSQGDEHTCDGQLVACGGADAARRMGQDSAGRLHRPCELGLWPAS